MGGLFGGGGDDGAAEAARAEAERLKQERLALEAEKKAEEEELEADRQRRLSGLVGMGSLTTEDEEGFPSSGLGAGTDVT